MAHINADISRKYQYFGRNSHMSEEYWHSQNMVIWQNVWNSSTQWRQCCNQCLSFDTFVFIIATKSRSEKQISVTQESKPLHNNKTVFYQLCRKIHKTRLFQSFSSLAIFILPTLSIWICTKTIICNYLAQYGLHDHNNHPNCVSWQHVVAESSLARFKFVNTIITALWPKDGFWNKLRW